MSIHPSRHADDHFRACVLRDHGATTPILPQLLAYTRNVFHVGTTPLPLPDESFVADWEQYVAEAARIGAWECLRHRLVQLQFPIRAGISETDDYRRATRMGHAVASPLGLELERPDDILFFLHGTPAGRIPVIAPSTRNDFVSLIRSFVYRNEPVAIPDSMGACIVGGYNNWDRFHSACGGWAAEHAAGRSWDSAGAFQAISARRELYQDRFLVLSRGPYSGVTADSLGLDEAVWEATSFVIRLEHESTHYLTRRLFGSMKNALHDELIADCSGISAAAGRFRADWFLRFMGLEDFPRYRPGGRLENYRGSPPLSSDAFQVLQSIVHAAAHGIEQWDTAERNGARASPAQRAAFSIRLASMSLERLAALAADAEVPSEAEH